MACAPTQIIKCALLHTQVECNEVKWFHHFKEQKKGITSLKSLHRHYKILYIIDMHIHNIHKNVTAMYSTVHSISDLLFFIEMQPFDSNAIFLFIRFALSTNIKFRGLILPHFQYYGFKCFLTYQNKYLYKIHFWGH